MYVAAAGVLMNGTVATLLWRFSGDVNIRSVFSAHAGRYAVDGCGHCGRRGDPVHRHDVDRPCAVDRDCRNDSVEFDRDYSRNAEHSAGRNPAKPTAWRDSRRRWHRSTASSMFTIFMSGALARSRMLWRATSRSPRCRCRSAATSLPASTAPCVTVFTSPIRRFSLKRRAARPRTGAARLPSSRPLVRMIIIMGTTITAMPTRAISIRMLEKGCVEGDLAALRTRETGHPVSALWASSSNFGLVDVGNTSPSSSGGSW